MWAFIFQSSSKVYSYWPHLNTSFWSSCSLLSFFSFLKVSKFVSHLLHLKLVFFFDCSRCNFDFDNSCSSENVLYFNFFFHCRIFFFWDFWVFPTFDVYSLLIHPATQPIKLCWRRLLMSFLMGITRNFWLQQPQLL